MSEIQTPEIGTCQKSKLLWVRMSDISQKCLKSEAQSSDIRPILKKVSENWTLGSHFRQFGNRTVIVWNLVRILETHCIFFLLPIILLSSLPSPSSWARLSQHWSTSPCGGTPAAWRHSLLDQFIQVIGDSIALSLLGRPARVCLL